MNLQLNYQSCLKKTIFEQLNISSLSEEARTDGASQHVLAHSFNFSLTFRYIKISWSKRQKKRGLPVFEEAPLMS